MEKPRCMVSGLPFVICSSRTEPTSASDCYLLVFDLPQTGICNMEQASKVR